MTLHDRLTSLASALGMGKVAKEEIDDLEAYSIGDRWIVGIDVDGSYFLQEIISVPHSYHDPGYTDYIDVAKHKSVEQLLMQIVATEYMELLEREAEAEIDI